MPTNLAFKLGAFVAVIVVKIGMRCIATRASGKFWNLWGVGAILNRSKRFPVGSMIFCKKYFVVFREKKLRSGNCS